MSLLRRFWNWYWPPRREFVDWQALVDELDIAAAIGFDHPRRHWIIRSRYSAQVIADYHYAAVLAGNLDLDAIDGELFALDAALSMNLEATS